MPKRLLLLFDIDGTLLKPVRAHGYALGRAIREIYGVGPHVEGYVYAGATDCMIIADIAALQGVAEEAVQAGLPRCVTRAIEVFRGLVPDLVAEPLPGVSAALEHLRGAGHLLGLVTGNLEPIAHLKLQAAGLDQYFLLGGFGSDHRERCEMVRIALAKAREAGQSIAVSDTYLIGDTPRDIQAGKTAGVLTVGVATGRYSAAELLPEQPDILIENMADLPERLDG